MLATKQQPIAFFPLWQRNENSAHDLTAVDFLFLICPRNRRIARLANDKLCGQDSSDRSLLLEQRRYGYTPFFFKRLPHGRQSRPPHFGPRDVIKPTSSKVFRNSGLIPPPNPHHPTIHPPP